MSHADTLRDLARDIPIGGMVAEHPHKTDLLAGADALEAIGRVRNALTEIDRLGDDAWAVWKRDADMYEQGRTDAYDRAHTLITEALEGES